MQFFDAHFHVIDPRFPLTPNQGYLPPPFTVEDYRAALLSLGLKAAGGAVVSGSFQAFDQNYLLSSLKTLGPEFVGVTQIPFHTPDTEILRLASAGIKALRFNVRRGGSEDISRIQEMAERVYGLARWHVELYMDARDIDAALAGVLSSLPSASIDHLGLSAEGLPVLLRLAERGVRVKATGFSRTNMDVRDALHSLASANPDCLMFGTDLPSTRAPIPFSKADVQLLLETFAGKQLEKILSGNAAAFYGLPGV
jgi:predicted TIM-barrel fold metal-dependent hydrolase